MANSSIILGAGGSTASGTTVEKTITQAAHGFTVGQWLYLNGSVYTLTDADVVSSTDSVGVVSVVTDANNFKIVTSGYITGLSGLIAGSRYYISSTAGGITVTAPSNAKAVFIADTTTSGWVQQSAVGTTVMNDQTSTGYFDVGGMRIQWGKTASTGDSDQTITFPISFSSAPSVTCNIVLTTGTNAGWGVGLKTVTSSSFLANRDDSIADTDNPFFHWIAIGQKA
jgi:hypothetical protein